MQTPRPAAAATEPGGDAASIARRRPWRYTPWLGGLFIAGIVALAALGIWRRHANAVAEIDRELDALSRVIAEQTARSVQTVDLVLQHVAGEFRSGKLDRLADEAALHDYLRDQSAGLVQVAGLSLIDADGRIRASSSRFPQPQPRPDVGALPSFQQLKATANAGLMVVGTMRGINRPEAWMFPLGRRLERRDGSFAGAIAAAGRVEYFQNFYRDLRLDAGSSITLLHRDGTVIARYPAVDAALGQRFAGLDALLAARAGGRAATARGNSPIDGVDRFGAVQAVAGYPLAVAVTRDASVALAGWRHEAVGAVVSTLALALLAAGLLVAVQRQLRRLESARASLEHSRERFALAAAGSDDGIIDWDIGADSLYASARAREILGLEPGAETQSGADWYAAAKMHPDDVAMRRAALDAHLAGRTPVYACEYRVRHGDGRYRWVRVRGLCSRDAHGRPLRMAGSVSDIDARRRAEDALRISEERYALAMAGSSGGHWVWEPASDALFVSPTVNRLFGLPADTQPKSWAEYFELIPVHPEDRAALASLNSAVRDGSAEHLNLEYRIVLEGQSEPRWILTRAQRFSDPGHSLLRVAGVSVDITERKRTEQALRLSDERFTLAVAGSKDGIIDWDLVNDRMYTSERMLQMVGAPTDVTVRTRAQWMELLRLHPDDRERHARELQEFLGSRETLREGEYRVRGPDGGWFWIRLSNLCVRDAAGRPLRLAGSVSDVDAYKRVEAALRESEERYALAMTGSDEGHWVWDMRSGQVYFSAKMSELFGFDGGAQTMPAEQYFASLPLHPDDAQALRRSRERHAAGETERLDHEFRIVRPDTGEVRWLHSRGRCFCDAAGRPMRMAGATVDITQRKRSEEALRVSEERFALAVAGSDDGVWDWDFVAGVAFESARARELQGLPPGPAVQPLSALVESLHVHPDDAPRRAEGIRAHLAGETAAYECEYRVRHDDGEYRWIRVRALCTRDERGQPVRMAGSVSDIDARKHAEQALRASEKRFALAVAGSNDGILDWDIVADRMYVSERALQIVGVDPSLRFETRKEWAALLMPRVHPDDARRIVAQLGTDASDHPLVHDGEYRVRHADGQYRWVRFRGRSVLGASGHQVRWAGSLSDIDAQKSTEEALRRSEQRYQLAVEGSAEGLWDWDLVSDTLFLSPRAQLTLLQQAGEPLRPRREWIALAEYHPDDQPALRAALSAHLRGESRRFRVEYRARHHSGEWRWLRMRGIAVRDAAGRPTRMAGSLEDITDRKTLELERERIELQLRQAQKLEAIGTLAGGIAHDFNNILAAILGYGEMAQKDAAEGSALRRNIDAAMSAGMRAKSLVERILAFSRSGLGERVPVHVESVVAEALDAVAASLPPGIRLVRELGCGDAAVLGDPTQVHQVVMNLCANAVQAMKTSGTLTVQLDLMSPDSPRCATSVLGDGSYVRLRVADTGSGIAPELLERIFDPFFTTKEVGVGTGLGLSLVHGIVTDLGGGIDVHSTVGQGATFAVYLPWQSCVAPARDADEAVPAGNGETVLLIDDEESLVRLGEEMIAGLGYEPVGFTSSLEALETFRAAPGRFDMILSDEAMPGMTGSELALAVREIRGDIPIVLMSGYVTPAMSQRARDAGVAEVLAKPLVARDIARSLAGALQPQG